MSEDIHLVQQRAHEFFNALKPQTEYGSWLVNKIAVVSIRIDRCERIERRVRDKGSLRAEFCWEDDRKLEAIALGERLAHEPEKVVELLRGTPQGCEWLMTRWAMLARVADLNEDVWTADQTKLAFDLLGTPREFRDGFRPGESLDFEGNVVGEAISLLVVARREVEALKERRDLVEELDEVNRVLSRDDLTEDDNIELKRLRRHESTLHGRFRRYLAEIRHESPDRRPLEGLKAKWIGQLETRPEPVPEPKTADEIAAENHPSNAIHPPFCIEPDELDEDGEVDIPAILKARREQKLAKAEARRHDRRRKAERLRA